MYNEIGEDLMAKKRPDQVTIEIGDITGSGTTNVAAGNITQIFKTKPARRIPHMVEPPPAVFVGREADVEAVLALLKLNAGSDEPGVIAAVRGMGGVGKSTLLRAVAHAPAIKAALPGGVLKVELGEKQELLPDLVEWGRQIGLDLSGLKKPESCKAALLSALSSKKLLLILDDVWKVEQAGWFLVGGPGCRTLITTRKLDVAVELAGAHVHYLQPLSEAASNELLTKLSPQAIHENADFEPLLYSRLGGLPLALNLVGQLMEVEQQSFGDITQIIERLDDFRGRLDLKPLSQTSGDGEKDRSLRAILWLSYEYLPDDEKRRVFRLLGVFARKPGVFTLEDAAAVWQKTLPEARTLLASLIDLALVERTARKGSFTLHPLLTDFALSQIEPGEQAQASQSHAARYLAACQKYRELEPDQWSELDACWENIKMAADWAAGQVNNPSASRGIWELAVEFAVALDYVFQVRKIQGVQKWLQAGVQACERLGRRVDQGWLTLTLGIHALDLGQPQQAEDFYRASISIFKGEDYKLGEIYALGNLGTVQRVLGRYLQALEAYQRVTKYCMVESDKLGAAIGLYNQADVRHSQGQNGEAMGLVEQSLGLLRQEPDWEETLASVLCLAAKLNLEGGELALAESQVSEVLEIAGRVRAALLRGKALAIQGESLTLQGQRERAKSVVQESLQTLHLAFVKEELAEAYETAARCAVRWGEASLARQYLQAAAQIYAGLGAEARVKAVNRKISEL